MPDEEIQELCTRIYRKHQLALDLIYEHRPDMQAEIRDALLEMIKADPTEFTLDVSNKTWIRFRPVSWDRPELQRGDKRRIKTSMMVLFSFWNSTPQKPNMLGLRLALGKGDESVRRQIWEAAGRAGSPFTVGPEAALPTDDWTDLFWKDILNTAEWEEYEDSLDYESLRSRLQEAWSAFKSNELPRIKEVIEQAFR